MTPEELRAEIDRFSTILSFYQQKDEQYFTIDEAAAFLKVKRTHFYHPRYKDQLPYVKMGKLLRYRKSDLVKLLESNLVIPKTNTVNERSLNL